MIVDFINEVISDMLAEKVWYHSERTLAWIDGNRTYELHADDDDVVAVYQFDINSDERIHPFHSGLWQVRTQISTTVETTGKALILRSVKDPAETVFYTARTIPKVANIASFPDQLANLIPWGVCALILGGSRTVPARHDPNRQAKPEAEEGGSVRDWRFFEAKFLQKRADYLNTLKKREQEIRPGRTFRRHQPHAYLGR
jgi:hypothetical protein